MHLQPVYLTAEHDLSAFDCGVPILDAWLRYTALRNESNGASRTYVLTDKQMVIAYYSISTASIKRELLPGKVRRNKPDPIPVLLLGRFAVDSRYHGMGIGHGMYQDVIRRCLEVSEIAGVVALTVHAISEEARSFYMKLGFTELATKPFTMYLMMREARKTLSGN